MIPAGVILPIPRDSVKKKLPSGAAAIETGWLSSASTENSVTAPDGVILPTLLPPSVNQSVTTLQGGGYYVNSGLPGSGFSLVPFQLTIKRPKPKATTLDATLSQVVVGTNGTFTGDLTLARITLGIYSGVVTTTDQTTVLATVSLSKGQDAVNLDAK